MERIFESEPGLGSAQTKKFKPGIAWGWVVGCAGFGVLVVLAVVVVVVVMLLVVVVGLVMKVVVMLGVVGGGGYCAGGDGEAIQRVSSFRTM